ncbi:MAG: Fic family protein [Bdellovibrionales bacterium]|nr:Fic family protein [Bdellovibrionales bacterium]
MSFLDSEARYDLDAPNPHGLRKVKTVVKLFCDDPLKARELCTPGESAELERTVAEYRANFAKTGQPIFTAAQAKNAISAKLQVLNEAWAHIDQEHKKVDNTRLSSTGAISDSIAETSREALKNIKSSKRSVIFNGMEKKYGAFREKLIAESSDGIGLLLYTDAFRNLPTMKRPGHLAVESEDTIRDAVKEIQTETLKLAKDTLSDAWMAEKIVSDPTSKDSEKFDPITGTRVATRYSTANDILKTMLRRAPVAAGQVLADDSDLAHEVCRLKKEIAVDDANDARMGKVVRAVAWGGMIVGGILVTTGVLAPAGLALSGAAVSTLETVNLSLNTLALVSNTGYTAKRYFDLKEEVTIQKTALVAKTGGSEKKLNAAETELDSQAQDFALKILETVAPIGIVKASRLVLATETLRASAAAKTIARISSELAESPKALAGIRALDYICAVIGSASCNLITSALARLPPSQRKAILSDQGKLRIFVEENQGELTAKSMMDRNRTVSQINPKTERLQELRRLFDDKLMIAMSAEDGVPTWSSLRTSAKNWLKTEEFVAAYDGPVDVNFLKQIHKDSMKDSYFWGYEYRRLKQAIVEKKVDPVAANAALKKLETTPVPFTGTDHNTLLGVFRSEAVDNWNLQPDHVLPGGQKYFTASEMKEIKSSRYLELVPESVKEISPGKFTAKVSFTSSSRVESAVNEIIDRTNKGIASGTPQAKLETIARGIQDLMSVHPFIDGNGRSIRFFADAWFTRSGFPTPYLISEEDLLLSTPDFTRNLLRGMDEHLREPATQH